MTCVQYLRKRYGRVDTEMEARLAAWNKKMVIKYAVDISSERTLQLVTEDQEQLILRLLSPHLRTRGFPCSQNHAASNAMDMR